jgi:hypothetical protein
MKIALIGAAMILGILAAVRAEAGILYSTTDLGSSYTLETTTGGLATNPYSPLYGVANSDGSVIYAFDKSPVTSINLRTNYTPNDYAYQLLNLQNGTHQVGYLSQDITQLGTILSPAPGGFFDWFTQQNDHFLPISDINSQGQFVGTSRYTTGPGATFAAFSNPNGLTHDVQGNDSTSTDNLNNYIPPIPGVTLTSAFAIDDLGRIIAFGSNSDAYLLTPSALGSPATVPEPPTSLMLGLAGSLLGIRSLRRRWNK